MMKIPVVSCWRRRRHHFFNLFRIIFSFLNIQYSRGDSCLKAPQQSCLIDFSHIILHFIFFPLPCFSAFQQFYNGPPAHFPMYCYYFFSDIWRFFDTPFAYKILCFWNFQDAFLLCVPLSIYSQSATVSMEYSLRRLGKVEADVSPHEKFRFIANFHERYLTFEPFLEKRFLDSRQG